MNTRYRYIVIEGLAGSGKTALAQQLVRRLGARPVLESVSDNPFLSDFFEDPSSYALPTQMAFLMARFKQKQALAQGDLFDRMVVSDYLFERDRLYAERLLDPQELEIYRRIYRLLEVQVPKPDLVVHLTGSARPHSTAETHRRIGGLGRAYSELFQRYAHCPVVEMDISHLDLRRGSTEIDGLLDMIQRGRSTYPSGLPNPAPLSLPGLC